MVLSNPPVSCYESLVQNSLLCSYPMQNRNIGGNSCLLAASLCSLSTYSGSQQWELKYILWLFQLTQNTWSLWTSSSNNFISLFFFSAFPFSSSFPHSCFVCIAVTYVWQVAHRNSPKLIACLDSIALWLINIIL